MSFQVDFRNMKFKNTGDFGDYILRGIRSGLFPSGYTFLPQKVMAQRLGVSRNFVRTAYYMAQGSGLATITRDGLIVN